MANSWEIWAFDDLRVWAKILDLESRFNVGIGSWLFKDEDKASCEVANVELTKFDIVDVVFVSRDHCRVVFNWTRNIDIDWKT